MSLAYYNENDPNAVAWLRELIKAGLIVNGIVDERSITDVNPYELTNYTQHHFFAGIGGWSYALRLAGWPDKRRVVTASCPCQPFSVAGKGFGTKDPRHLWPVFCDILTHIEAATVFGEQVASPAGREWLAGVRLDLEGLGYAVGAADLCAAGVTAPHIRQRLYWVADSASKRRDRINSLLRSKEDRRKTPSTIFETSGSCEALRIPNAKGQKRKGVESERPGRVGQWSRVRSGSSTDGMERTELNGWWGTVGRCGTDGKSRRLDPGIEPLAYGIPDRVALLRGSGNAIVPQVAAKFIGAFLDTLGD